MCINPENGDIWILSDEARQIFRINLQGQVLNTFVINVLKPEGLAIDFRNNFTTIFSNSYQKLLKFELAFE